jgi:uncharacterized membrane protein YjfL (UPF0719 family)
MIKLEVLLSSLLYSVIGVAIFWICFIIIDLITPFHLWKEIVEEKNLALGVLMGAIALGVCVIIAAAIH